MMALTRDVFFYTSPINIAYIPIKRPGNMPGLFIGMSIVVNAWVYHHLLHPSLQLLLPAQAFLSFPWKALYS